MSFGFSVGDIVALSQLAWTTFRAAEQACGRNDRLSREIRSLHTVLQHEAERPESILNKQDDPRLEELIRIIDGCRRILDRLSQVLGKYNGLSDETRRATRFWQKVRFGSGEVEDLSSMITKLSTYTYALNLCISNMSLQSLGEVETRMVQGEVGLMELRESINWVLATLKISNEEGLDDDTSLWRKLRRELVKEGYSSAALRLHKKLIKDYVLELAERRVLGEPEVADFPETASDDQLNGSAHSANDTELHVLGVSSLPQNSSPSLDIEPACDVEGVEQESALTCPMCYKIYVLWCLVVIASLAVGFWRSFATNDEGKGFTDAAYVVAVGGLIVYPIQQRHAQRCNFVVQVH